MKSKLGVHVIQADGRLLDFIKQCKPAVVVSMDHNLSFWQEAHAASPNTLIIGRPALDDGDMPFLNGASDADQLFARIAPDVAKMKGIYAGWAGPNEPTVKFEREAIALSNFYVRFASLTHQAGTKVGAYSFAAGNPMRGDRLSDGTIEPNLWLSLAPGAAACDWLFLHEYSAPTIQNQIPFLFLRHRSVYESKLPQAARRPIILTELGVSGETIGKPQQGWNLIITEWEYLKSLKDADEELKKTFYVLGAAVFCWYGFGINDSYTIRDMKPLHDYIAQGGEPQPPPAPNEKPTPLPQAQVPELVAHIAAAVIKSFETLYVEPTKGEIGWSRKIRPGETFGSINRAEANNILRSDIDRYGAAVYAAVGTQLGPAKTAALISLCYNIGTTAFASSTLVEMIIAGDIAGAAEQFVSQDQKHGWIFEKKKILPGLVRRRLVEKELFLS